MTGKRFEVVMNEFDEVEYIMDKVMMEDRDFAEFMDFVEDVCKENEQLQHDATILIQANQDYRKENEQLKAFIQELTTKGTGRIDLANGYSYKVDAILIDFKR